MMSTESSRLYAGELCAVFMACNAVPDQDTESRVSRCQRSHHNVVSKHKEMGGPRSLQPACVFTCLGKRRLQVPSVGGDAPVATDVAWYSLILLSWHATEQDCDAQNSTMATLACGGMLDLFASATKRRSLAQRDERNVPVDRAWIEAISPKTRC